MALWPHLHQVHLELGAAAPGELPDKLQYVPPAKASKAHKNRLCWTGHVHSLQGQDTVTTDESATKSWMDCLQYER